jgi:hypothetical protein
LNATNVPRKETPLGLNGSDPPLVWSSTVTTATVPPTDGLELTQDTDLQDEQGDRSSERYQQFPDRQQLRERYPIDAVNVPAQIWINPGVDDHSESMSSNNSVLRNQRGDSEEGDGPDGDDSDDTRAHENDPRTFLMDVVSATNTNARTSRNVYDGSISSATLPSEEGLFGDDDDEEDEEEEEEEEEEGEERERYEREEEDYQDDDEEEDEEFDGEDGEREDLEEESDEEEDEEGAGDRMGGMPRRVLLFPLPSTSSPE